MDSMAVKVCKFEEKTKYFLIWLLISILDPHMESKSSETFGTTGNQIFGFFEFSNFRIYEHFSMDLHWFLCRKIGEFWENFVLLQFLKACISTSFQFLMKSLPVFNTYSSRAVDCAMFQHTKIKIIFRNLVVKFRKILNFIFPSLPMK